MTTLTVGLLLFLGAHSVRIVAEGWRQWQIARLGEGAWRGLYSLLSLIGVVLIVYGYGLARGDPVVLWNPPGWTRYLAAALTLPAFILIAAAYVPRNHMKASVGHPMVAGVKLWALAHLLSNGLLADVLLFGAFLLWAIFDFRAARRRDRAAGVRYPAGTLLRDTIAAVIGAGLWLLLVMVHQRFIGVAALG